MSTGEFSVYQFFDTGDSERVREGVDAEEAVKSAAHYNHSVGAQIGITRRVIITDSSDYCVFEWKFGEGVVFPPGQQRTSGEGAQL